MNGVSVVGCGHWGKNLVRNFAELGSLAAVSDPDDRIAKLYATEYRVPSLPFEKVLNSDVSGVVIAAPAFTHSKLAIAAFEAGKHVYVEKPLALSLDDADSVIQAARRSGKHLMVGHLLQYHAVFSRLKGMVEDGVFGKLQYIYSNRMSAGKLRSEEDVVWSFAPHDVSMILSLAGEEVLYVRAEKIEILQSVIADIATLYLDFHSGLKGQIRCSWLNPDKEQKLVIIGNSGMAIFDDTQPWEKKLAVYQHGIDLSELGPVLTKAEADYISVPESEPLKDECRYFIDLMAGRVQPRTDGAEAKSVLEVLMAASPM
jgi:UDP-2-acetamido-3-amino-2,3-dideoxy-glucuronate N-acetyltransferase